MSHPFTHLPPPIRGAFRTDDAARAVYAESAGVLRRLPRAVAVPADLDDVRALVRWAAAERLPLIPRGSGSSMAGGAVGDGIVIDLSRLNTRSPVDNTRRSLWAAAGVVRREVEHAANAHGLRFPVDPSSGTFATIGGMAATNAAGPRTLAHGAMRRWVEAVDCVFDDGSHATIRRGEPLPAGVAALDRWSAECDSIRAAAQSLPRPAVRKDSSGYGVHDFADSGSLVDLLVGSEGTLALLVAVELRLAPLPEATASVLVAWPTLDHAVVGAALARAAGAAACELLDRTFLDVARSGAALPVPDETECVLLIELEGDATVVERAQALARDCETNGALGVLVGLDAESEESLWALRHAASPILSRLDPNLKSMQVVEDGCVPPERLADYVRGVRAALDAASLRGVVFGHAGDAHVHVNALVDVREGDWRERVRQLFGEVVALTASLGGTLAGEHGDGRLRTPSLDRTWSPEARAVFARIKHCFDPGGILNPGVIVPVGTPDDPLADNKYDPSLPAHPPAARAVLDRVERERAYDRPRLEMLDSDA
jgi:FAD/FMN-containing dehydrogenase